MYRLVGGLEVLGEMEAVPTNAEDKPMVCVCVCVVWCVFPFNAVGPF